MSFILALVLVLGCVNAENPCVERTVEHNEEDANGGRNGGACTRFSKVTISVDVDNWKNIKQCDEPNYDKYHVMMVAEWYKRRLSLEECILYLTHSCLAVT